MQDTKMLGSKLSIFLRFPSHLIPLRFKFTFDFICGVGSGKTFTMLKTAELLFKVPESDKPTILLLIDRNELEGQLGPWRP